MPIQIATDRTRVFVLNYLYHKLVSHGRNDHTTMTAPHPVRSAKLSMVGPG
jgi:hypothetical protein